ncbi:glyoxalase family protein [Saccharopolyspora erythraea NRRL 2338]|uniref:Glyoxalase/bleomycin resistance protein/dioxygenase n=2 Tax=Saccharopolyspora erythraea TaxID=1836 RepID=A4FG10_SACEN|nr:ring-cleaving dioxygenase [Saccharopolyspora erythraea]EQD81638.1 diguanylate cyclase [Saccharopolyspora erythraea D]PFG96691.1 glyoxalase family protein [Saccharopolyspora erythraea NRRL 2338]QRK86949.1 ring-cleaving dioxygenase [Saccharopolyspora erythraea]CAM02985.1 glyoxalase/bleomycin resistance protein/dioxygenase [Saccharopolyspora erythraea NRRL 2338]
MTIATSGLHHVTAIAGDPQRNADFYLRTLGLRMVKTTVNFDDPGTYHLYYGDEAGRPGSLITFFPWKGAPAGRRGTGQATTTAFSVPEQSLGWWKQHLDGLGVDTTEITERDGERALGLRDPDGLAISLVAHPQGDPRAPWDNGIVPAEHGIRGLHSVTLAVTAEDATVAMLGDLGLRPHDQQGNRLRFAAGEGGPGAFVDVLVTPAAPRGLVAAGTVHHVAWRAPDEPTQAAWRAELADQGVGVTSVLDRQYFRSIYFREPGGTLLEIATDEPGFTADEPLLELGRALKLPPWLEPNREQIQATLPELDLPDENNPELAQRLAENR